MTEQNAFENAFKNDCDFLSEIIAQICDYAIDNDMEPNDTIKTIAKNILTLKKIADFNNWERRDKMKIELTPHDLGAAFCNFNQKCFAPCAECAAFINGFCGGDPSAADLEEIGAEIVKEWKERGGVHD